MGQFNFEKGNSSVFLKEKKISHKNVNIFLMYGVPKPRRQLFIIEGTAINYVLYC